MMNIKKIVFLLIALTMISAYGQNDYISETKEFTTLCDLDLPKDNAWGFNQVYVHYKGSPSGKGGFGPALVKLVQKKNKKDSHDVYSYQCLSGSFTNDIQFTSSLNTKKPGSFAFKVSMDVVTGNSLAHDLFHGVDAAPNEIEISWKNALFGATIFTAAGKCKPVNIPSEDEFVGCFTGYNLEGLGSSCKSTKEKIGRNHYAKLCNLPHVDGVAKKCESGAVLCSKRVAPLLINEPWTGYKIDGTKVSCVPRPPSACLTVAGDPVDGVCEASGGVQLPDCSWKGSECRSICTKKMSL